MQVGQKKRKERNNNGKDKELQGKLINITTMNTNETYNMSK